MYDTCTVHLVLASGTQENGQNMQTRSASLLVTNSKFTLRSLILTYLVQRYPDVPGYELVVGVQPLITPLAQPNAEFAKPNFAW